MNLPPNITERFPFLDPLEEDWRPVARWALAAWMVFYLLFLYQAYRHHGPMLMIDAVFVPIHEGGHLLFRFLGGEWIDIAAGTGMQLFVPFALAVYFAFQRPLPARPSAHFSSSNNFCRSACTWLTLAHKPFR